MATGFPVKANYATGDVLTAANMNDLSGTVNYLQYMPPRNPVLNSNFSVWQRGTSFTNPTAAGSFYTADRWGFNRFLDANGTTISRSTDAPTGIQYSLKWQRTASDTNTGEMDGWYAVESKDSYLYAGKTVTLSFYAKKGANYSGGALTSNLNYGTGTDQRPYAMTGSTNVATASNTLTTSWQRFTASGTVSATATQLALQFAWNPTGTAGADDSVYITGVQIEVGSSATTYYPNGNTYQAELAACQRYYYRTTSTQGYQFIGIGGATSTTNIQIWTNLPVQMRTIPASLDYSTLQISTPSGTTAAISAGSLDTNTNSTTVGSANFTSSGLTANTWYYIRGNNSTSAYIAYSAEL